MLRLYDAHNHLQDERLRPFRRELQSALDRENVTAVVVNGSCEGDWEEVLAWARRDERVLPSFGYHPWYVRERSTDWEHRLLCFLERVPSGVGEVGLDRWVKGHDLAEQSEVFMKQLRLGATRNVPVSIHCLQAWGTLRELLSSTPRPACGFVLHSFEGPQQMIQELAELGAYFSLPGYFAHDRKERQREAFRHVPPERLLVETDAPDQLLPENRVQYPLHDKVTGKPLNHPGNLGAVYHFGAELLGMELNELTKMVERNFLSVFGGLMKKRDARPRGD